MHEENELAERGWRTIVTMKDAMLIDGGLPNDFWAKAIETANYLRNRLLQEAEAMGNSYLRKPEPTNVRISATSEYLEASYLQTYLTKRGQRQITRRRGKESSSTIAQTLVKTSAYGHPRPNKSSS